MMLREAVSKTFYYNHGLKELNNTQINTVNAFMNQYNKVKELMEQ